MNPATRKAPATATSVITTTGAGADESLTTIGASGREEGATDAAGAGDRVELGAGVGSVLAELASGDVAGLGGADTTGAAPDDAAVGAGVERGVGAGDGAVGGEGVGPGVETITTTTPVISSGWTSQKYG
jgi:hypothetical protein